jgi:uncharacterized ubiquitin-like protein YukD
VKTTLAYAVKFAKNTPVNASIVVIANNSNIPKTTVNAVQIKTTNKNIFGIIAIVYATMKIAQV